MSFPRTFYRNILNHAAGFWQRSMMKLYSEMGSNLVDAPTRMFEAFFHFFIINIALSYEISFVKKKLQLKMNF